MKLNLKRMAKQQHTLHSFETTRADDLMVKVSGRYGGRTPPGEPIYLTDAQLKEWRCSTR